MTLDFSRVRFIMTEPSHPGNVGSAARAIKTMGFTDLVLVSPKIDQITAHPEAIALASGANDVLEQAQVVSTLQEALAPVTLAFGMTARERDLGPPVCDIRQAAGIATAHLADHAFGLVGLVVGTERSGLTNAQVSLCHRLCCIPANPAYSSLNVSQAMQLAAWEMRYALLQPPMTPGVTPATEINQARNANEQNLADRPPGRRPASSEALQALIVHWEEALIAVQFLDPAHPKKLMPRMRHMFGRSDMTRDEVEMWRGVCSAMLATARHANPS